jgi:hypothetical protein
MTNINLIPEEIVQSKIMIIRGKKVILDKDIALLYDVKSIVLRQQVKRNIDRFPEDFMFTLTEAEITIMVSQNVIPSKSYFGGSFPYVFTEQGVAMLSSILNSTRSIQVNIQIMRTFAKLREIMVTNSDLRRKIEEMEGEYNKSFMVIFKTIKELLEKPKIKSSKNKIGFNNTNI